MSTVNAGSLPLSYPFETTTGVSPDQLYWVRRVAVKVEGVLTLDIQRDAPIYEQSGRVLFAPGFNEVAISDAIGMTLRRDFAPPDNLIFPWDMNTDTRPPSTVVANREDGDGPDHDRSIGVIEAPAKPKLKEPPMYKVIMLNDDYTPMEFVVEVLQTFFGMDREKATQVMLAVHTSGKATCGIFTRDVAETKCAQVNQYAQDNQHPLVSDIEAVE